MYHLLSTCLVILLVIGSPISVWAAPLSYGNNELISGYITVVDEADTLILQTGHIIHTGDQYINEDNKLYEITVVEGALAKARYIKPEPSISFEQVAIPVQGGVATDHILPGVY